MNLNSKKIRTSKILLLIVILMTANMSFANSELENLINNYYGNTSENLLSMRNTKTDNVRPINQSISRAGLKISDSELKRIANKIFINETGGKKDNLVDWNVGESFPSLGIGHFIWMRAGQRSIFGESFPGLVKFYREKGIKLPKLLERNTYSPWNSRAELLRQKNNGNADIIELIEFFDGTRDIQILYIFERLEMSLDKMMRASKNSENVRYQFYRVANSPNGLYALIDYVNFKGEGISTSEGYKNQGWGLRHVLENMNGKGEGRSALVEFSNSARYVLERRVRNAPRNESQWLAGWTKRVETYKN